MKCSIDSNTREIIFLDNSECFGVEFDKNTQRIEFSCPKIVGDNLDLTKCTCRINYMNAKGFRDSYLIDDILVDGDNITFTWALKSKVTAGRGICLFIFCARQVNENGVIEKEWNTTVAKASIKRGLETNSHIEKEYSDILESILLKINSVSLTTEVNEESTNESIPTAKAVYDALQDIDIPSGTDISIGTNGNWYIGGADTGKPSRGEKGDKGDKGPQGTVGPVGPGAEVFYVDIEGNYPNYTCPVAMADIKAAYEAGKALKCRCKMGAYTATLPLFLPIPNVNTWLFSGSGELKEMGFAAQTFTVAISSTSVQAENALIALKTDIPTSLPNPEALTIKIGDVSVEYNGVEAKTVTIADGMEVEY